MEWMGFDICGWGENASGTIHWTYCKWKNLKNFYLMQSKQQGGKIIKLIIC